MILTLSALAALARACAPAVAPETLVPVVRVESGFDPLAIGVNGAHRRVYHPRSTAEAVAVAGALLRRDENLDLGLGQINSRNLARLGLGLADAFDPCRNLAAGAQVLQEGYRRADPSPGEEQLGLRVALSFYNTGHPRRGFANGYVARVTRAAAQIVPALAASPGPTAAAGPAEPPGPPAASLDIFAGPASAARNVF